MLLLFIFILKDKVISHLYKYLIELRVFHIFEADMVGDVIFEEVVVLLSCFIQACEVCNDIKLLSIRELFPVFVDIVLITIEIMSDLLHRQSILFICQIGKLQSQHVYIVPFILRIISTYVILTNIGFD